MSDPFAVLDAFIDGVVPWKHPGLFPQEAREALEAIRQEREEALAAHLDDCPVLWKASVDWGEQLEAAERKLAALREAAAPFRSERGYCCDGLPPDCIHDALREALEGEA